MMTITVAALRGFVQLFGKLEGPCIVVMLMESIRVALKDLFLALCLVCEAQTIFGGKLESISEQSVINVIWSRN